MRRWKGALGSARCTYPACAATSRSASGCVRSYELGSGKVHDDGAGGTGGMSAPDVGQLKDEVVKIQEMMLLFSERLGQLERTGIAARQHDGVEGGKGKRRRREG